VVILSPLIFLFISSCRFPISYLLLLVITPNKTNQSLNKYPHLLSLSLSLLELGLNAGSEYSEKSKKEKVRSLSAVAKALSMGCRVSHSPKPTKKFKLPRKVLLLGPVLSYAFFF